jgi:hypothetical protein
MFCILFREGAFHKIQDHNWTKNFGSLNESSLATWISSIKTAQKIQVRFSLCASSQGIA